LIAEPALDCRRDVHRGRREQQVRASNGPCVVVTGYVVWLRLMSSALCCASVYLKDHCPSTGLAIRRYRRILEIFEGADKLQQWIIIRQLIGRDTTG
jgi:hypothetical protein